MDEKIIYAIGGAVAGALVSGGGVWYYMKTKWENDFTNELEIAVAAEVKASKKFYTALQKTEYPTPGDLAAEKLEKGEYEELATQYTTDEPANPATDEMTIVTENVFTNYADNSTWDADKEEADRDPSKPYVISSDEFFENAGDFIQTQLTWFAEDGVLADTQDKPCDEALVGEDNLSKFGHGSKDPNLVYVRNEAMDLDFEISYAEGKYSEQVMGFMAHGQSPGRALRRFKLDDE